MLASDLHDPMRDAARPPHCPYCGAALVSDEVDGLCPACLLLRANETSSAVDGASTRAPQRSSLRSTHRLNPGDRFGAYRVIRFLGRGGMGEVFEVEHEEHARRVAMKVLATRLGTTEERRRFLEEGRLAASIRHPHTVYVFGSEEIDGLPVITMELLSGGTLADRLEQEGALGATEAVDVILAVIEGLAAAEACGILHRDIKPGNCFIDTDGTVKVGDFGLSISTRSQDSPRRTLPGAFRGTPEYAPPEQVRGEPLDVRSDIYAVGATLYTLLTGRPPFDAPTLDGLFTRVVVASPPSPRWVDEALPEGLASLVVRCLAKDADERPQSYVELADLLRPFSRQRAEPAGLDVRFAAGVIDSVILFLAAAALTLAGVLASPAHAGSHGRSLVSLLVGLTLYYSLSEWRWGASPGKRLMGLRVTCAGGEPLTVGRALLRAGMYVFAFNVFAGFASAGGDSLTQADLYPALVLAALFVAARRRNGYAALHDHFSRSRVVTVRPVDSRVGAAHSGSADLPLTSKTIGPYALIGPSSGAMPHGFVAGYDEVLRRPVWIRSVPAGAPAVSAARQDLRRPGRLRWLNGRRSPDGWDAFEAVPGRPFEVAIEEKRGWATVRVWLRDIADELRDGLADRSLPRLELSRLWITDRGGAILLDWPATPRPALDSSSKEDARPPTDEEARAFLNAVAARAVPAGAPFAARSFLGSLAGWVSLGVAGWFLGPIAFGGWLCAHRRPDRRLQEWLAGTRLVSK